MADTIKFSYKGKDYVLEFTRKSIKQMERNGFRFNDEAIAQPVTFSEELFYGAFLANHKNVMRKTADEIYEQIADKGGLRERLMEMYSNTMTALFGESDDEETEENENFIHWE
jgi:hypothetical protein